MSHAERARRASGWLLAAALAGALAWALLASQRRPQGPVPVAWDRVACARCSMLVSEPGFAAQLLLASGEVLQFDDPGCLLLWQHEHAPEGAVAWFHHRDEDRWLDGRDVRFVPVESSPMGYGLAAVDAGRDGLGRAEALDRVLDLEAARRPEGP